MTDPSAPGLPGFEARADSRLLPPGRDPAEEEHDLRDSLAGLSQLSLGATSLPELLTHVAEFAVHAIPGADGAGLTLLQDGRPDTIVATAPFVREVDDIQYRLGEGPCITAAAEARTVRSGSLGGESAFPRFGPRAGRLGVHSVLSLPLLGGGGTALGAMNVYAHRRDAFDERAATLGELFAVPAAISVHNAQLLSEALRLAAQLEAALATRGVIDQAMGIVMSRTGSTPEETITALKALSQQQNRKLSVVAQSLLDDAVRGARARRTGHRPHPL